MAVSLHILFVAPYTPSPIRVRTLEVIRHLTRSGHRVTLAALHDSLASPETVAELETICHAVHIVPHDQKRAALNAAFALPTPTPLWAAYCSSPAMERLLVRLVATERFDIAHVEHLRAAHFAGALGSLPRIIDAVDCITDLRAQMKEQGGGLSRLLSWEEWAKLKAYEPRIYRGFARIAVASAHDAATLASLDPLHLPPIEVVPNGVDAAYFSPPSTPPEPQTLLFSGKMSYAANDDAARYLLSSILPRIRAQVPEAHLLLAGSGPTRELRRMASRIPNVTVTGYVDDLRPFFARAAVAVCPLRIGVGIQNKALEAMAMARPVVGTPLVARALKDAEQGGGLRVSSEPEGLADAVSNFLLRPLAAHQAGKAARAYVVAHHDWKKTAESFAQLYAAVLAQ